MPVPRSLGEVGFDSQKIADTYDQIALNFSATRQKLSPEVIKLIPSLPTNATVLDLGCGNGVLLHTLQAVGSEPAYLGIDISQQLLNEAKRLHPQAMFHHADITREDVWADLPRFDFIAALAVFHHLFSEKDRRFVLKQIKGHLKPDGIAIISIWRLDQPKFDKFRQNSTLTIPFHGSTPRDFYNLTELEITTLSQQTGLTISRIHRDKNNIYLILHS